jgi:hypothetical protein
MKEKRARYVSHAQFIDSCIKHSKIPKGFRIKCGAELEIDNDIADKCNNIRTDASIKIMELTREACARKNTALTKDITVCESQVDNDTKIRTDLWERNEERRMEEIKRGKWERLQHNAGYRAKEIHIKGDGNCFYRCLSRFIYNTEVNHAEVRHEVNEYINAHKTQFACFVDGSVNVHIEDQSHTDGRHVSWATEAEVYAASALYKINIYVANGSNRNGPEWHVHKYGITDNSQCDNDPSYEESMHVKYSNNHFSLLNYQSDSEILGRENAVHGDRSEPASTEQYDWFDNAPVQSTADIQEHNFEKEITVSVATQSSDHSSGHVENNRQVRAVDTLSRYNRDRSRKTPSAHSSRSRGHQTASENEAVTNLSSYKLTQAEQSLLTKGLKFIPDRTKIDTTKLLSDLGEWERRMRLREFFHDRQSGVDENEDDQNPEEKFRIKKKSFFTPKKGRDVWLDLYIELVKNDVVGSLRKAGNLNVTKEENSAFMSLLHNKDIVIRPADKGSGIVIVNKSDYIDKLYQEMTDNKSYCQTDEDLTEASAKSVRSLVNKMHRDGAISKGLKQYLIPRYPAAGKLKGNPKLHKPGNPYRVIVSGVNSATEKIAEVAEHELNEYVVKSPSYLKDTTDFLQKLKEVKTPVDADAILFCFDVRQLYPSVPREEGIEACKEALKVRTNPIVPTKYAVRMIETVLDNNNFNFGDKHFTQTGGVAIGSRLGCNFASAYMRKWDEQLLQFDQIPTFYKRYIDDGFGIWSDGLEALQAFAAYANNIHPDIKIELRWSKDRIEFLDTWVVLENGCVYTDLYTKPTDKQLYIYNSSCHPAHTKKGLAYSLGLRLKRICQRDVDYNRHRAGLKSQLRKRGYSGKSIENQLRKVDILDRESLLKGSSKKTSEQRIPLVVTYSKLLPDIRTILRKHETTLYQSERMRNVFSKPPLLAYRRDRNIADVLVHTKTNKALQTSTDSCVCAICQAMYKKDVMDTAGQRSYKTIQQVDCTTRNVVYGLRCSPCERMVYVGETERTVKERINEHLRDVRCCCDKPINRHFENHAVADVQVVILSALFNETKQYRLLCEEKWIRLLGTAAPDGCNIKRNL